MGRVCVASAQGRRPTVAAWDPGAYAMTRRHDLVFAVSAVLLLACGPAPGTRPHDMSVEHHEEAAGAETELAAAHEAEYDPDATAPLRCSDSTASPVALDQPCWTGEMNPTAAHRAEADRHRELAAAHRAAAAALHEVEARECVGLSDADRDQSPFSHREDIASVSDLTEPPAATGDSMGLGTALAAPRVIGATVVLRAVPGLTVEWLQRAIECHLARNSVLGHDVPEMAYCPLVPAGVTAVVRSVGDGFAVDIRADGEDAVAEIVHRARALMP